MARLSQTQLWLLQTIHHPELTQHQLTELSNILMAPDDLQSLYLILENAKKILPKAKHICTMSKSYLSITEKIDPTLKTVNLLLDHIDTVTKAPILSQLLADDRQTPEQNFLNKLESHPLYSMLGHKTRAQPLSDNYHHLQAQIFVATHIIHANSGELSLFLAAFRGARYLSYPEHIQQLEMIPQQTVHPAAFCRLAEKVTKSSRLAAALTVIEKSLSYHKESEIFVPPQRKTVAIPQKGDNDDKPPSKNVRSWTKTGIISKPSINNREAQRLIEAGGHPEEVPSPVDAVPVVATSERTYTLEALNDLTFQAKQSSNQMAIRNQNSHLAWQELNQHDIAILLQYLSGHTATTNIEGAAHIKLLLTVMFWGCCSMERALKIGISPSSIPHFGAGECLYLAEDNMSNNQVPYLRLTCPGPELSPKSADRQYQHAIPVVQAANIPLPSFAYTTITNNYKRPEQGQNVHAEPLFPLDEGKKKQLLAETKTALRELNKAYGTRLTPKRITMHLFRTLSREKKTDVAAAALFFGKKYHPAKTRIHYTVVPLVRMEAIFKEMCKKHFSAAGVQIQFAKGAVNHKDTALGTPWCPQQDAVRNLCWNLQRAVETTRSKHDDLDSLAKFHNFYTLYTGVLIAFATGYRAVTDPSLCYQTIDPDTHLAIISDKESSNDKNYSTRVVYLPEICRQQIDNYRDHLIAIWDRVGATSAPLFELLKKHSIDDPPLELFVIDPELSKTEPFGQTLTQEMLRHHYDYELPANSNRHYLRNQLISNGCPVEITDVFMGHWELGQEPWNSFSNLSYLTFRELIKKYLEPIITAAGWQPLIGYANGR